MKANAAAEPARITLRTVLISATAEIVIALFILHFTQQAAIADIPQAAVPSLKTAGIGLAIGLGMAVLQVAGINASQRWRDFLARAVGSTPLGTTEIVIIGMAVGIAEELLFRAAIQPLVGVTVASLIFAAVHWNYAAVRGSRETIAFSALAFALVFLISIVLGHVFVAFGLGAAIIAHASYDIVVLLKYRGIAQARSAA